MAENIKVNELEIGSSIKDEDRFLVLTDDVNNEVKTIAKQNVISSLISNVENNLLTNNGGLYVDGNTFNELLEALRLIQERDADQIGRPIPTFSNTLLDDEIWLEGATVSREQYAQLFNIYGETYGAGDGSTTFKLPDCRKRVFWGASNFGYLEPELPDITGAFGSAQNGTVNATGAFAQTAVYPGFNGLNNSVGRNITFAASRSNPIYKEGATVGPPRIKCRVKTRFK